MRCSDDLIGALLRAGIQCIYNFRRPLISWAFFNEVLFSRLYLEALYEEILGCGWKLCSKMCKLYSSSPDYFGTKSYVSDFFHSFGFVAHLLPLFFWLAIVSWYRVALM